MLTTAVRNAAFSQTYAEYRGLMFALARRILGDDALAEDAVSEASIKLLEHYDCLDAPISPRTRSFTAVLTERTAMNLLRKRRREYAVPPEELPRRETSGADPDLRLTVLAALDTLPGEQRTAVLLSCLCGLTAKQVGESLGCTQAKAEKLISRGREKLKKQLREAI